VSLSEDQVVPFLNVLNKMYEDSTYSAQVYFEAAKSGEFWGKVVVFVPAIVSAVSGVLVALDLGRAWGVASAVAGSVAATGSFLGAEKKAASYKESARNYTRLRHDIGLVRDLALEEESVEALRTLILELQDRYNNIVLRDEPSSNRFYRKVKQRIQESL
jgi:hypothetical protein